MMHGCDGALNKGIFRYMSEVTQNGDDQGMRPKNVDI